jgi:hypothetical protein
LSGGQIELAFSETFKLLTLRALPYVAIRSTRDRPWKVMSEAFGV